MKALSLRPEWAMPVLLGLKTVECRTWRTDYRGKLLICSSNRPSVGTIAGYALCVVDLVDIVPFTDDHLDDAMLDECPPNSYAWILDGLEWVEPFPVKGKLSIYDVDDSMVSVIPNSISNEDALARYYEPLIKWSDRHQTEKETREWWEILVSLI